MLNLMNYGRNCSVMATNILQSKFNISTMHLSQQGQKSTMKKEKME